METHQRNGSLREAERDADGDRYEKGRSDGDRSGGEDRSDGVRSGGRERERARFKQRAEVRGRAPEGARPTEAEDGDPPNNGSLCAVESDWSNPSVDQRQASA